MVEEDGEEGDICMIALTVLIGIVSITRSILWFLLKHRYFIEMQMTVKHGQGVRWWPFPIILERYA